MDTLTAHTNYIVLAPSKPTDKALVKKISQAVADIDVIREAHLPDVIEFGLSNSPVLTLFAVVSAASDQDKLMETLNAKINAGFFNKKTIDIKIIPENFPLLQAIRDTNCLLGWRD